jgi:hypothetical protein
LSSSSSWLAAVRRSGVAGVRHHGGELDLARAAPAIGVRSSCARAVLNCRISPTASFDAGQRLVERLRHVVQLVVHAAHRQPLPQVGDVDAPRRVREAQERPQRDRSPSSGPRGSPRRGRPARSTRSSCRKRLSALSIAASDAPT